ncbi:hypothetical protein P4O66_001591 [Electrophorus voltai]|uniref:Uncharacterized protein n=1 Tax=Electrophorus voltai TaxID=2609070 RepID=A0AAD8Z7D6_9TELE|nr:hypothetical protein P4O66_001591 [Electrophorus voltai]
MKDHPDMILGITRPNHSYRLDKSSSDVVKYLTNFAADLNQSYHLQASRDIHPSITLDPSPNYNSPKFRSRNQSYMRAVSTLSQASCVSQVSEAELNGQFESVCESVFSEVESQAMEALDLPGCFRTRSHSYLRAIQAGYSQDDDCVPSMTSSAVRSAAEVLKGTGLLNEDYVPNKETDMTSAARRSASRPRREDESRGTYGYRACFVGPPPPPPKTSTPARPRPVQSSVQETADLALAISQQWKEDVSAMRKELADLRRDLCTELRAFNTNFSRFTQRYNTWSPSQAKETQHPVANVSVSTQAGGKSLVRQNTADAAVNCPSPVDPIVLSTQSPEPLDPNILHVSSPRLLFQTDPNSLLAEIDDPTFANLTPPEHVDLSTLCWPELDPDNMTPPDPPEPELPLDPQYFSNAPTPERVDSIVLDFTNLEPVNLANLHWPKLDPENLSPPDPTSPQELLDTTIQHPSFRETLEEADPSTSSPGPGILTEQWQTPADSVSPIMLVGPVHEHMDPSIRDCGIVEQVDSLVLSPLTPESMDLNDLKWPSLESLDPGLPSPGSADLPDPPSPEIVDYDEPPDHEVEEPPFPEILDTIFLQPATPEPADPDVSNPQTPEPMSPPLQSAATFEQEAHSVVLWSKRETLNRSDSLQEESLDVTMLSWPETDPEILSPLEPGFLDSGILYSVDLTPLESGAGKFSESGCPDTDDQSDEESSAFEQVMAYPLKQDTLDSATIDLLESETLFSAILCSVEPDVLDFETTASDEGPEIQEPGSSSPATIDPATVHPFNLSLLEIQAALDVSKRETADNGSPIGTVACSSPSLSCRDFLWIRWQRRARGKTPMSRSASMEIYHKKYSNNSEMSYMSLSL